MQLVCRPSLCCFPCCHGSTKEATDSQRQRIAKEATPKKRVNAGAGGHIDIWLFLFDAEKRQRSDMCSICLWTLSGKRLAHSAHEGSTGSYGLLILSNFANALYRENTSISHGQKRRILIPALHLQTFADHRDFRTNCSPTSRFWVVLCLSARIGPHKAV